jgi:hypothetical protein
MRRPRFSTEAAMKNSLSIIILFGALTGTAVAQTPTSFYAPPSEIDYRTNGSSEFATEDLPSDHPDFGDLQSRLGLSGIDRLYIPRLGNPTPAVSFGNRFGDSGLRQFGFGTGHIFGPVRATFAYHSTSNTSGPLLSGNRMFSSAFTFAGGIKLSGLYQLDKNDFLPDNRETREWILGASAPFGANTFMASYIRHINKTMNNADASSLSLGYDYSLSKQTHLYTSFSHLLNEGGALRLYTPGDGENQVNAGIRHQF